MNVIDFRHQPLEVSQRRLADLPDRVVKGDPRHETHLHFRSTDGSLIAGSWTSTPGKWRTFKDRDEYCHIITGRCALISEAGQRWEFGAGQSFMIPNGFSGYWEILETTTKHFVIKEHQSSNNAPDERARADL